MHDAKGITCQIDHSNHASNQDAQGLRKADTAPIMTGRYIRMIKEAQRMSEGIRGNG